MEFIGDEDSTRRRWPLVVGGALLFGLLLFVATLAETDRDSDVVAKAAPEPAPVSREDSGPEEAPPAAELGGELLALADDGRAVPDLELSAAVPVPAVPRPTLEPDAAPGGGQGSVMEGVEEVAQATPAATPAEEPGGGDAEASVEPEPTSEPTVAAPAAVLPDGCIEFQSNPGGATVWLDAVQLARSAKPRTSSQPFVKTLPERGYVVEMGFQGERTTRLAGVQTRPGVRLVVSCDLASKLTCKVTEAGGCP